MTLAEENQTILIIYAVGLLVTYTMQILFKHSKLIRLTDEGGWGAVFVRIFRSIIWPISTIFFVIRSIIMIFDNSRPPKWL